MTQQIKHLINGQSVASAATFETINPATQEVLAEVAAGGEAEVHVQWPQPRPPSPVVLTAPAPQRAKLVRKLGDLIAAHVPRSRRPRPTTAAR